MSRTKKILDASRKVKEDHLKNLLEKINEGTVTSKELDIVAKLEAELSKGEDKELSKLRGDFFTDGHGVAAFFDVTNRTIQLWVKDGGCPRLKHGLYDLKAVFAWWIASDLACAKVEAEDEGIKAVVLATKKEQYEIIKVKRKEAQGKVAELKDVAAAWGTRAQELGSALNFLEDRVASRGAMKPREELKKIVRAETRQMRTAYCREGRFCEWSGDE